MSSNSSQTLKAAADSSTVSPPTSAGDSTSSSAKTKGHLVRKRLKGRTASPQPSPAVGAGGCEPGSQAPPTWQQRLTEWATGPEGISLVASAAVHGFLFLMLVLVLYMLGWKLQADEGQAGPINALFTEHTIDEMPDLETFDLELDLPTEGARDLATYDSSVRTDESLLLPDTPLDSLTDPSSLLPTSPDNPLDDLEDTGGDKGRSNRRSGFAMPRNKGKVVTQGSFSVWTVPEDPTPGRNYLIVIQLNRKVRIRNLAKDVTGSVTGSDGYFTDIGLKRTFPIQAPQYVISKARQVVIKIPPPKPEVEHLGIRDKIIVKSKTLDETQEIEIVF